MPKKKTMVVMLLVLALSLGAIACQKLNTGRSASFPTKALPPKVVEPIPLEYGELVAVTANPEDSQWIVLWFQKPDKTIVVVDVNTRRGIVQARATFPRN